MTIQQNSKFIDRGIVYPDSDGKPMAENTLQALWIFKLYGNLQAMYADQEIFVAADLFWYPVEGNPKIRVAPDVLVVFGRPDGHRGSYKQWMEDDIPLHVAVEILSPSNTPIEMIEKLNFYQQYGVLEYVVIDPEKETFIAYERKEDKLIQVNQEVQSWTSTRLKMTFVSEDGKLDVTHLDGTPLKTFKEIKKREESLEAENESLTAEKNAALNEVELLKARLRELGEQID